MHSHQTSIGQNSTGTIIQINFKLLWAACLLFVSWWIWPNTMRGYGYGVMAILMSAGAFGLIMDCLRMMAKLHTRDKEIKKYMALGNKPKSSKMASLEALRKAGMIHDE